MRLAGEERIRKPRRMKFGFSVVELLVVIAIIALLLSLLLPGIRLARSNFRNTLCRNRLMTVSMGVITYTQANIRKWPFHPESYNHFQRGQAHYFPNGFPNRPWSGSGHDPNAASSLVPQLASYFGTDGAYAPFYRGTSGRSSTVDNAGNALGPDFVCPEYTGGGHGSQELGLVDANGGGNHVYFMTYNLYPGYAGTWRHVIDRSMRLGQPITFGMNYRGREYNRMANSYILLSDYVAARHGEVNTIHTPQGMGAAGVRSSHHMAHMKAPYHHIKSGTFVQNTVYQDGSMRGTDGEAGIANIKKTHLDNQGTLIPLQLR